MEIINSMVLDIGIQILMVIVTGKLVLMVTVIEKDKWYSVIRKLSMQLVVWKNDIQKEWLSYEGYKEEEKKEKRLLLNSLNYLKN